MGIFVACHVVFFMTCASFWWLFSFFCTHIHTHTHTHKTVPEYEVHGMPALSPTATEGAVVEWLIKEGEFVEEGTEIAQVLNERKANE